MEVNHRVTVHPIHHTVCILQTLREFVSRARTVSKAPLNRWRRLRGNVASASAAFERPPINESLSDSAAGAEMQNATNVGNVSVEAIAGEHNSSVDRKSVV